MSTVFLGDGFCGSVVCSAAKPRGKQAAMVVLSSELYMSVSVENCVSCEGAHVPVAVVVAEQPRKSSNFGPPPLNMERSVASCDGSTVLLPVRVRDGVGVG